MRQEPDTAEELHVRDVVGHRHLAQEVAGATVPLLFHEDRDAPLGDLRTGRLVGHTVGLENDSSDSGEHPDAMAVVHTFPGSPWSPSCSAR